MIKRAIYPELKEHLSEKEITLITGPRQSGKTTLMQLLIKELQNSGEQTVYLNLDIERDFQILDSQENFLEYLRLQLGTDSLSYVFIDEIQRKENAGIFLKGLYDMTLPYKFVVSGSGSVELKEKISEGLSGRKKEFRLSTVSFREFVNYKTAYKFADNLDEYFDSGLYAGSLLEEYLQFGGYPKLLTVETLEDKRDVLESIYNSFIDRDLKELLDVRNTAAIGDLFTFLSNRIGQLTPTSEVSNKININYETAVNYLYYLEKTFQISTVRPYSTNSGSELTKTPVYYFEDLGMRNFVFNRLSHYDPLISGSMLFQNLIFLLLAHQNLVSKVNFWRTKDKAEIDLIANIGALTIPVEVKYQDLKGPEVTNSMRSFISRYSPEKLFVVNKSLRAEIKVESTAVRFIPYYDLITNDIVDL